MAWEQNNVGNIVSGIGHISGDCFVKPYDANFANWADINPSTWEADLEAGTIDGFGFVNVGFITTDGAPEIQTPDTEDMTTTTDLWDGIPYKTGRTVITGRHLKFTLAEADRDSAILFLNGAGSIINEAAATPRYSDIYERGSNPVAQSIIIPTFMTDNRVSLLIIERGMVVIDDVVKYTPNEPIVYAIDVDPQTGAKLGANLLRRREILQAPTPPEPPVNP